MSLLNSFKTILCIELSLWGSTTSINSVVSEIIVDGIKESVSGLTNSASIDLVSKIGGIILLITGILIFTNQLQILGYSILNILPFLQNFG